MVVSISNSLVLAPFYVVSMPGEVKNIQLYMATLSQNENAMVQLTNEKLYMALYGFKQNYHDSGPACKIF